MRSACPARPSRSAARAGPGANDQVGTIEAGEAMTVSVQMKPDVEARLTARARSIGQSLEAFIQRLLEREACVTDASGSAWLTGAQKAQAYRAWAKSFPASLPNLSLEDVSREKIYHRK